MKKINSHCLKFLFVILFTAVGLIYSCSVWAGFAWEHKDDQFITVYDEQGDHLFSSARGITIGDSYISEDNYRYRIVKVDEDEARAEKQEKVDLREGSLELGAYNPFLAQAEEHDGQEEEKKVAIYFTHNGESYEPGPVNVEARGDVHRIGEGMKQKFEQEGIHVSKSENIHLPHDGGAYTRSRSTALELAQQGPSIVLDVHRDAVPDENEYLTQMNGEEIVQVRLVLGRQNPNREVNEEFARYLKAVSDEHTPGLIKDIFFGQGEYNQALHPRSILLEVGTHKNNKEQARQSAAMLAGVISNLLHEEIPEGPTGRAAWKTVLWIIVIISALIIGYLYMVEGDWPGVKNRLKNFISREIIDRGDTG